MEKLNLNKFQDSKLEPKQMSYISAGLNAGDCTGGGVSFESHINGSGQYVETTISWDADETGYWGQTMCYSGYRKTVFICAPN